MERKQMEDLIQRLWDQGASIEIMKILEHDKQQREALVEAVGLLRELKNYGFMLTAIDAFLAKRVQAEK